MQGRRHARDEQHGRHPCRSLSGNQSATTAADATAADATAAAAAAAAAPAPAAAAPAAGGGGAVQRPEVLQQLYATIEPLGVYLQRVLPERPMGAPLLQDRDLQDYRYVLERCLVAQPAPGSSIAPARRRDVPRSPASEPRLASSQPEVVRQVIETLFRESASPEHVLALGNCRPRFGGMGSNAFHGVEQLIPSSAASALQTRPWAVLLQRIGDAAMMTLLLDCSLFLPTLGSTLLQLSGAPVNKVVHQMRAPTSTGSAVPGTRKTAPRAPPASPPYKRPVRSHFCDVCVTRLFQLPLPRI